MVFLPIKHRCFALSFGHVSHNLKDVSYEYDFGLKVTLNCVDPNELRSTNSLDPSVGRRQRTQLPVGSDLTLFDFDRDTSILRRLTGKVKQAHIWTSMRGWSRDEQRAVFQPTGVASFLMIILAFGGIGIITFDTIRFFLLGLPVLAIGTWLGWMLYGKLDEGAFRRVVLVLLLVSGAALTASAWR